MTESTVGIQFSRERTGRLPGGNVGCWFSVNTVPHLPVLDIQPAADCGLERKSHTLHLTTEGLMLRVDSLKKVFRSGESDLVLFENLSFEVKRGEMLAIVGESGAGKSTLLHILSALDRASAGDVYCADLRLNSLSHDEAADFRNREAGFVWQFHYLLPEFTAAENVAMPLLLRGQTWQQIKPEATPAKFPPSDLAATAKRGDNGGQMTNCALR